MMDAIRKHWLWVALVGVLVYLVIRRRRAAQKPAGWSAGQAAAAAAAGVAAEMSSLAGTLGRIAASEPNVDTDPAHVTMPDQTAYPGWRLTGDGVWFNPSTGESYSRGTSPPATLPSAYDTGAMVRPIIDVGDIVPVTTPEVYPDAVIF